MNSTAVKPPVAPTKLCHLIKRPDFEGYGFNLHSEKIKPGQFIGKVDAGSPAESAGLKKGDRIIEVNGVSIGSETHKQVVQRIKVIENEVRLLLSDVDGMTPTTSSNLQQQHSEEIHNDDEHDGITTTTTKNSNNLQQINNNNNNKIHDESSTQQQQQQQQIYNNNSNNNNNNSDNNLLKTTKTATELEASAATTITSSSASSQQQQQQQQQHNNGNTLHLPLTAAEMRAKLMSKKKYDPKSESVDIKKKFQIIQTL